LRDYFLVIRDRQVMNNDPKIGLKCSEFEALLAEALDGTVPAETQASFDAHGESCATCGPLWSEAQEGMLLLRGLEELEPPKNLRHNILAATTMKDVAVKSAEEPVVTTWQGRLRRRMQVSLAGAMHSRFATSFAMAFFSLSLTLTLAGVKVSDVKNIDWHPSALRKSAVLGFTHVEAKVTSYYENLRLVYEVQAKVRELRKNTPAPETTNDNNKQQNRNAAPDGGRPQEKENYSRELDGSLIAKSASHPAGAQI
jgi:Putative zinc-finger